jgi:hypothetical protein
MTIEETLKIRADDTKKKLKEFNHKFIPIASRKLMKWKKYQLTKEWVLMCINKCTSK